MKRTKFALLALIIAVAGTASVAALDVNDIISMRQSGVQDEAIINMVQNQKLSRPLSVSEVIALKNSGASSALLEYLTRSEAAESVQVETVTSSSPTIVESAPTATIIREQPTVVVKEQPTVVVKEQPTVYYSSSSCATVPQTTYVVPQYVAPRYVAPPRYVDPWPHYRSYYGPNYGPRYYFGFSYHKDRGHRGGYHSGRPHRR